MVGVWVGKASVGESDDGNGNGGAALAIQSTAAVCRAASEPPQHNSEARY